MNGRATPTAHQSMNPWFCCTAHKNNHMETGLRANVCHTVCEVDSHADKAVIVETMVWGCHTVQTTMSGMLLTVRSELACLLARRNPAILIHPKITSICFWNFLWWGGEKFKEDKILKGKDKSTKIVKILTRENFHLYGKWFASTTCIYFCSPGSMMHHYRYQVIENGVPPWLLLAAAAALRKGSVGCHVQTRGGEDDVLA